MENNNYPEETLELLDRYLRQELSSEEKYRIEEELANSESLREQLVLLQQSQEAIHAFAVRERVQAARNRANALSQGKHVYLDFSNRKLTSVAAIVLPLMVATVLFSMNRPGRVYSENYLSYQLPINRNTEVAKSNAERLFQEKEYQQLAQMFHDGSANNKEQRDLFLVAIASMELHEFEQAVQLLETLKKRHGQEREKRFEQESDFYLALAYAKTGKTAEAKEIFKQIRANKRHLYHKNISYWDVWRLSFPF